VLRDQGYPTVQVTVPKGQVEYFEQKIKTAASPTIAKIAATYQRTPGKVTIPGGYYAEYAPHPREEDSNTWQIYAPMGKLEIPRKAGELTLDFYDDAVSPYPSIRSIHLNPEYIGKGIGRAIVKELAKFYGGITSDPQGVTSGMAISMWNSLGAEKIPTNKNQNKGYFYQITAADMSPLSAAQTSMKKFLREFWPGLPTPQLKIVHHARPVNLGRCLWESRSPDNSVIEIQKSICTNENLLDKIMAHELCHHSAMIQNAAPLIKSGISAQEIKLEFRLNGGHGKWWLDEVAKVNAKYGQNFVTKYSDMTEGEQTKEFYVLLYMDQNAKSLRWQYAVRPSKKQLLIIELWLAKGAKLVKSKDLSLAPRNDGTIGSPKWYYPGDKVKAQKLSELWNEAPAAKI
jgi:hypothetical protein